MSLLKRVVSAFETISPLRLADTTWDNVGILLQVPYPNESANKVLLTIDLTPAVFDEAIKNNNIGVIVAYHPLWFRGWKRLNLPDNSTPDAEVIKQSIILKLAAKSISLYCPHSALDSCKGGINDWLAFGLKPLGIESVVPITPTTDSTVHVPEGVGRIVYLREPQPLPSVINAIKSHLGLSHVRVAQAPTNHKIRTIAICAGSGASVVTKCVDRPDMYWTGEMSHHEVLAAMLIGTHVVLCEHTNTERGYLKSQLKPRLEQLLPGTEVIVSQADYEPLCII